LMALAPLLPLPKAIQANFLGIALAEYPHRTEE